MAHKLVIGNTINVPVKFGVNDAGTFKQFAFDLVCTRLMLSEVQERTESDEEKVNDFLRSVTTGWIGQSLVVDEDGKPSAFSTTTFDLMLSLPGVSAVIFRAYFAEVGAKAKN